MDSPLHVRVVVTERRWLRRVLRLSGGLEATIELNARGFPESWLRVDGEVVPADHDYHPLRLTVWTFRFSLPGPIGPIPAALAIFAPLRDFRWMSLSVQDVVVYEEEDYGRTIRIGSTPIALPIPSRGPQADAGALPVIGAGPESSAADLPVPSHAHPHDDA